MITDAAGCDNDLEAEEADETSAGEPDVVSPEEPAPEGERGARRPWWRRRLVVAFLGLGLLAAIGAGVWWSLAPPYCQSEPGVCQRLAYERYVKPIVEEPVEEAELAELPQIDQTIDFYGIQYVPEDDFDQVKALNADTVLQDFPIDAGPDGWLAQLDAADAADLRVVAWLWTPGWEWDEAAGEWAVDSRAVSFLETIEGHPALLAVYGTHEAYWNECFGCGYTTAQLQILYNQIKAIADVPIYSAFSGFESWQARGEETTFADGVCDYCDTWYYPVLADGTYDRQTYIDRLYTELKTFRELAPNSRFVWVLQGFASERSGRSMPNEEQLADMAELASRVDIDGLWFYVWSFDAEQYEDVLGARGELHEVVRTSYDEFTTVETDPVEADPAGAETGGAPGDENPAGEVTDDGDGESRGSGG